MQKKNYFKLNKIVYPAQGNPSESILNISKSRCYQHKLQNENKKKYKFLQLAGPIDPSLDRFFWF